MKCYEVTFSRGDFFCDLQNYFSTQHVPENLTSSYSCARKHLTYGENKQKLVWRRKSTFSTHSLNGASSFVFCFILLKQALRYEEENLFPSQTLEMRRNEQKWAESKYLIIQWAISAESMNCRHANDNIAGEYERIIATVIRIALISTNLSNPVSFHTPSLLKKKEKSSQKFGNCSEWDNLLWAQTKCKSHKVFTERWLRYKIRC